MPSMKDIIHPVSEVSQSSTEDVTISNVFEVSVENRVFLLSA